MSCDHERVEVLAELFRAVDCYWSLDSAPDEILPALNRARDLVENDEAKLVQPRPGHADRAHVGARAA